MSLQISRALADQLLRLGCAEREQCGLLLGTADAVRFQPVENVSPDSARSFELDPVALIAAIKRERSGGEKLLGYFHTHPSGPARPSAADLALAPPDGRWWLIANATELRLWKLDRFLFVEHPLVIDQ